MAVQKTRNLQLGSDDRGWSIIRKYDRGFIDSLLEGVVVYDKDGVCLLCNKAAEQILGLSAIQLREKAVNDPSWKCIQEDGSPFDMQDFPANYTLRTGIPCREVMMGVVGPDSTVKWISINAQPIYVEDAIDPVAVTCTFVDVTEKRKIASDLASLERLQRLVLTSTLNGFYLLDRNFNVLMVNETAELITRSLFKVSIKIGDHLPGWIPEESREGVIDALRKALEGVVTSGDYEAAAGELKKTYLNIFRPVYNEVKEVIGICIVVKDVTDERRAQTQLNEKELLFSAFMNHASTFNWVVDEHDVVRYMNPLALRSFPNSSPVGKKIHELLPPDLYEEYKSNNKKVFEHNTPIEVRENGLGPDGQSQVHQCYKFPLGTDANNVRLMGGIAMNITPIIQTKNDLRKSNERYEYVTRATSEAIWDWDVINNTLILGEGAVKLFGCTHLKITLETRLKHIHPDDRQAYEQSLKAALQSDKELWSAEYRFRDMNDVYRVVSDKAYLIRNKAGKVVRMIGAMQDITDQRILEQKIIEDALEHKRNVIKAIISAQEKERKEISNELHDNVNQLLATCKLYLEVAENDNKLDLLADCQGFIKMAIEEIRNISHSLTPAAFEEKGLFLTIREMITKINTLGNLQIELDLCGQVESLEQRLIPDMKTAVYRILQEQINNILKHAEASQVHVTLKLENNRLLLAIKDDGKGFNPSNFKNGLGINNIRSRVSYYDGTMEINSSPGNGCELKVQIPMEVQ